ncbi:MAG: porin, partial [Acidobacteriota bacterium]|nr:porin [Acidobacteriota bacterium]
MQRMVSILLICLGIGTNIWAQQEHTPSSDQINQLLKRIETLEQTVHELREQIQSKDTPKGSPPEAAIVTAAQPLQQLQSQETPVTDPVVKISGHVFGDYYWMATHHDPNLKNRNGFWIRRAYLGLDKKLNQDFDILLRFEMNSVGDFNSKSKVTPFVKDAYLRWKFSDQHQAYFGLSATATWRLVNSIWGYRAVEKTML